MANDEYIQMVEDCMKRDTKLTDWESNFIDSLSNWLGAGKSLTEKQEQILDRLWEKVT
jgi:hypothetical protein